MTAPRPLVCTPEALHDAMRAVACYAVEHHLAHDHQADSNDVTRRYEQAEKAVAALFRPAEDTRVAGNCTKCNGPIYYDPEHVGEYLHECPAPVAPPPAGEPAKEGTAWAPVLVEPRTPNTESVLIHHAHRGQACVACELAALRSELAASQREYLELKSALLSPSYVADHRTAVEIAGRYRDRATKVIPLGSSSPSGENRS